MPVEAGIQKSVKIPHSRLHVRHARFLTTIFEGTRDPSVILDVDFRIVRVNDACAEQKKHQFKTSSGGDAAK